MLKNNITYEEIPHLKKYILTKSWRDTIDFLCKVIGNIGLRDNRVKALMIKYSQDSNFWVRRTAIEHQLGLKEKTDRKLLAEIIINNFGSTGFFINKAIGWSLRDYSKTNLDWVREFINKYKIQIQEVELNDGRQSGKSIEFEVENHDDILYLIEQMQNSSRFENKNENTEFIVGLKLFSEVMMRNRNNPLFEEFIPAFRQFMKKLKGK